MKLLDARTIVFLFSIWTAALPCAALWPGIAVAQVPADRDMLLKPDGGGEERAAEINGYPDPKRLLDLAKELRLSDAQKKSLRTIADETGKRASELGKRIVGVEEELNDAFKTGLVSEKSAGDDAEQVGRLRGKLRALYLSSRVKARQILTADQIGVLRKIRGPDQAKKR